MTKRRQELQGDHQPTRVIARLFVHGDAIARHLAAPMLSQREAYLGRLLASGHKKQFVADRASTLLKIVDCQWFSQAAATEDDILKAFTESMGEAASDDPAVLRHRGRFFIAVARSWTKFLGIYVGRQHAFCRFEDAYQEFLEWLRKDLGFLDSSVNSCAAGLKVSLFGSRRGVKTLTSSPQLKSMRSLLKGWLLDEVGTRS